MSDNNGLQGEIAIVEDGRSLQERTSTPLELAGQIANRAAGNTIFQRYLSEKSANTVKRHARDLELFAEYLLDVGIPLENGADFQVSPIAWQGVTWGIVEGYVQWLLQEDYAISSVNARLSTVRTYAQMAVKAGMIDRQEGVLIQSVKGFSRQGGLNVDGRRIQTRKRETAYAYKPEGKKRSIVVQRRATKKRDPTILSDQQAYALKQVRNNSPQAWRDALLMCLLLDHGLRASEIALLKVTDVNLLMDTMTFVRPKVKGTEHERTTHKLTAQAQSVASHYIQTLYPPCPQVRRLSNSDDNTIAEKW